MTAPETGGAGVAEAVAAVKRAYDADVAAEEQLSLLDPVSAEEMVAAREDIGQNAGAMTVLRHAREKRKAGRPPGALNKANAEFTRLLLTYGPDPMIGAYRLANTPPEVLIEASKQEKVHSFDKHNVPRIVIERMTYDQALAQIARARELIAPYMHGKAPQAIDLNIRGIRVIEEIGGRVANDTVDGEFTRVARPDDDIGEAAGGA